MRKLVYYVACSLDGFIAREDGSLGDFGFEGEHVEDILRLFPETIPTHLREHFGVSAENQRFDTVLMGRRTYEVGLEQGVVSPYQHLKQIVFSATLDDSANSGVRFVRSDAPGVVRAIKREEGRDIWLCGGGELASSLFSEIDELIIKSNPFLMGRGKRLFEREIHAGELSLISRSDYPNGFSLQHFALNDASGCGDA